MDETMLARVLAGLADRDDPEACWPWMKSLTVKGYGQVWDRERRTVVLVHRLMYEHFVAPIAPGLQIDHRCRNRACGNPAHMEVVTSRENVLRGEGHSAVNARKTRCPRGHVYDEANTIRDKNGWRRCRKCKNAADRSARANSY